MSNVSNKVFSHTHYGVSTIAAVLYAIAWLLGNQVRAEVADESTVLPAVLVTAPRAYISVATLDPIVVTGYREQRVSYATLEPVLVQASRNMTNVDGPTMQPAVFTANAPVNPVSVETSMGGSGRSKGLIAKVRDWVVSALLK